MAFVQTFSDLQLLCREGVSSQSLCHMSARAREKKPSGFTSMTKRAIVPCSGLLVKTMLQQ
jgi:hypothetical protein